MRKRVKNTSHLSTLLDHILPVSRVFISETHIHWISNLGPVLYLMLGTEIRDNRFRHILWSYRIYSYSQICIYILHNSFHCVTLYQSVITSTSVIRFPGLSSFIHSTFIISPLYTIWYNAVGFHNILSWYCVSHKTTRRKRQRGIK